MVPKIEELAKKKRKSETYDIEERDKKALFDDLA